MQYTIDKFEGGKTGEIMPATSCTFAEAKAALESESEGFSIRARNGGSLSFEWRNVLAIDGDIKKKIVAIGDASIIKMFDKTPYPGEGSPTLKRGASLTVGGICQQSRLRSSFCG